MPTSDTAGPDSPTPPGGPITAVLLDMDGTITDSAPLILESVAHTLRHYGLPVPEGEELMRYVGPPLEVSFHDFAGLPEDQLSEAVRIYREHYHEHMLAAPVYPGARELIISLNKAGIPLGLATSKNETYAVAILEHLGLASYFTAVTGADATGTRSAKSDVIREALARLRSAGVDLSRVVHVGDRHHDVDGAHACGLECVGALWGYPAPGELNAAEITAATPGDVLAFVLSPALPGAHTEPAEEAEAPGGGELGSAPSPHSAASPATEHASEHAGEQRLARNRTGWARARALLEDRIEQMDALRQAEREAAMRLDGSPAPAARMTASSPLATLPGWLVRTGLGAWLLLGLIIVVSLAFFAVAQVVPVFVGVFIALVITAILHPLTRVFSKVLPSYPAAFLALATAFAFVAGLVAYVVSSVTSQWPTLASQFSTGVDTILDFAEHGPLPVHMSQQELQRMLSRMVDQGQHYIESNATSLAGEVVSNAGTVVDVFVVLALALFAAIFFLASGGKMWRWFINELPARLRSDVHRAAGAGWYTFASYARGTVILALTDAAMAGVFLQLVGVPLAAPLAVLVFIGAFIPIIGAPSAMIVAMMVALASKGFLTMVVVGLGVAGIGQIEGHILQPLIMGRQVSLHPVVVLLAVAVGTFSAGLLGAVVAVPLVSVLWSIYSELHVKDAPVEGDLPGYSSR